jgi:hypothetical protein
MKHEFSPAAREELIASIEYYESQQPGLGLTFSEQIQETIGRINDYPQGWTPLDETFHRCLVTQFPYALIYTIEQDTLLITSVMNVHRKPDYWQSR